MSGKLRKSGDNSADTWLHREEKNQGSTIAIYDGVGCMELLCMKVHWDLLCDEWCINVCSYVGLEEKF